MALTVVKNLTDISLCENITSWSGSPTAGTTFVREGTNSLGVQVSNTTVNLVYTGAPLGTLNMTGNRIYLWAAIQGIPDSLLNGGVGIIIGDGTNQRAYYVGGSDYTSGFQLGSWVCYCLDLANLPTNFATITGVAAVNIASIAAVGVRFKTIAKAQGTSLNCFVDAVRYGTGITVYGSGLTFAQIAADDASTATGKAYGIIRQIEPGVYGLQGNLTFGDSSGTNTFDFSDSNAVVVVEDHVYGTGTPTDITITVTSNATAATSSFTTGIAVGSGDTQNGRNGVIWKNANTSQPVVFDASNANLKNFYMYGGGFYDINKSSGQNIKFSNDATNGPNHKLSGVTFSNPGQVDIGRVVTRECSFIGDTRTTTANLLWNANINIKNCNFIANTNGTTNAAAIEHPAQGTFSYSGLIFSSNDFDINYTAPASSGVLTINTVAGTGSNPGTYKILNATGNSVSIVNAVPIAVKIVNTSNVAIQNARVAIYKISDNSAILSPTNTDASGNVSTTFNYTADTNIYVRVRKDSSIVDSYIEANQDSTQACTTAGSVVGVAQSFTANFASTLLSAKFRLKITGAPTGNAVAKIYAHSGTYGTSSIPTGAALATSDNFNVANLGTSYSTQTLTFSGANQIALTSGTNYVLSIEYSSGSVGNSLDVGYDASTPTASGNKSTLTSGTWTAQSGNDMIFYVIVSAAKYLPIDTSGTITSTGYSATLTLSQDTIASIT